MARFLIVRLGSLGDVVHAIPVAAALRRHVPGARIDWMVDPRYVELLRLVTVLDRAIPIDPRGDWSVLFATIRQARRTAYDAAIDLQGLLKSAVLSRAAGAAQTIGFPRAHLREPWARFCYSRTPDPAGALHVVHKNLALLEPFGIRAQQPAFPLSIPRTEAMETVRKRFGPTPYALINPGAAWPNKRWPSDRFAALAVRMEERLGLQSLVLWGPGEEPLATAVADAARGAAHVAPPTTITDLLGIARDASVLVSGDTGPLHLAAAAGTPVVALFGPTRPERNGPWAPLDISLSRVDRCMCLYQRRCRRPDPCIDEIATEDVLTAVERRLAAGHGDHGDHGGVGHGDHGDRGGGVGH